MMYNLKFTKQAIIDLKKLKKDEPSAFEKAAKLIEELKVHPMYGTGKPKRLTGYRNQQWSRRINSKHRLVYTIEDEVLIVLILAASGHYDDK